MLALALVLSLGLLVPSAGEPPGAKSPPRILAAEGAAPAGAALERAASAEDARVRVPALAKVVFLGASVSAGFGAELAYEHDGRRVATTVRLEDALRATVPAIEDARTHADELFFTAARRVGERLAREARADQPSCVIALDFLFWYAYGGGGDTPARLRSLEEGLAQLAQFSCPVFVGDLPDVRAAPGLAPMAATLPDDAQLEALRERLLAWVDESERRHVIELARLVASSLGDGELEVGGERWSAAQRAGFFTEDGLHPTAKGIVPLARLVASALVEAKLGLGAADLLAPRAVAPRLVECVRARDERAAAERERASRAGARGEGGKAGAGAGGSGSSGGDGAGGR